MMRIFSHRTYIVLALFTCLCFTLLHESWTSPRRRLACSFNTRSHRKVCSTTISNPHLPLHTTQKSEHAKLDGKSTKKVEGLASNFILTDYAYDHTMSPLPSCGLRHIAVLLVGNSKPTNFNLHAEYLAKSITTPLEAHVFSVTDEKDDKVFTLQGSRRPTLSLKGALPHVFGSRLKAVGFVSADMKCKSCTSLTKMNANSTSFVQIRGSGKVRSDSYQQWHKLNEAWRLMAQYERQVLGSVYDVVIKLRFDCTPLGKWNLCGSDAIKTNDGFSAIHACTDHVFWGRRAAMEVAAAGTFPAIGKYFYHDRPNPMQRSMSVSAMLGSLLATPRELWPLKFVKSWKHYNKIGTLPYIDMHAASDSSKVADYVDMIYNMKLARESGLEYVDPLHPSFRNVSFLRGVNSNRKDYAAGEFVTEKDFLVWMISNNVTVCDLGAETTAVLYKGTSFTILHAFSTLTYLPSR